MQRSKVRTGIFLILSIIIMTVAFLTKVQPAPVELKNAIRQDDQQETFINEKKKFDGIIDSQERCKEVWDFYWRWAKKGNQRARLELAVRMLPLPAPPIMGLPGADIMNYSFDEAIKGVFPLVIHAMGVDPSGDDYYEAYVGLVEAVHEYNDMYKPAERERTRVFWDCWNNPQDKKKACIQRAVEEGVLPSFESFAERIDKSLQQGGRAVCRTSGTRGE